MNTSRVIFTQSTRLREKERGMNKKRMGEMIELSLSSRDPVHHERIDARGSEVREEKGYTQLNFCPSKLIFPFGKITANFNELLQKGKVTFLVD